MAKYNEYVAYHVHSDYSLLDSATKFQDYINKAAELGQPALGFSEHGNIRGWVAKKMACDAAGIKYLHGVEIYLTEQLRNSDGDKVRDNYHTVLIAKNQQGFLELNKLVSMSDDEEHKYYVGRISFDEFLGISQNVIKISACLASPLNKLAVSHPYYERLVKHYDYLEIQPHNCPDQISYNQHLAQLAKRYNKPLIAGTDAHSIDQYRAECRRILTDAKNKSYPDDEFDLVYKSRPELEAAFREQGAIPDELWEEAIDNTVEMAAAVESFELDMSLKYPILYGSPEADREKFIENIWTSLDEKLKAGIIPKEQEQGFREALEEEIRVYTKIGMCGFVQSMSEIIRWCRENEICVGPGRGSVTGSRAAYVTDVTDVNSEQWNTVFSRFANENRIEPGDVDTDVIEEDRPRIFEYIINRFGRDKTAFVPTYGTLQERACIEEICRGLRHRWEVANSEDPAVIEFEARCKEDKKKYKRISEATKAIDPNPYRMSLADQIKKEYAVAPDACKEKYAEIFYFFDGLLGIKVSQSVHPAGIVISPVTLPDNYGVFHKDHGVIMQIDMEEIHDVSLVKYDMLVLKTIQVIRDACRYAGIPYPRSHEVDWEDEKVWEDMLRSPYGIFQMEGDFAFKLLKDFKTKSIFDMSLVTACMRPSGASYRDQLIARIPHKNPSTEIDELLKDNYGYCIAEDQLVMTTRGEQAIRDVEIGDTVMTESGWNQVLAKTNMGQRDTVIVSFGYKSTLRTIRCTPDHELLTDRGWVRAKDLTAFDSLYMPTNEYDGNTYDVNAMRLIGWLIGDGILSVARMIDFVNQSMDVHLAFRKCVENFDSGLTTTILDATHYTDIRGNVVTNPSKLYRSRVIYKEHCKEEKSIRKYLRSVGLIGDENKPTAHHKRIPSIVFSASRQCKLAMLGAYTDTDSCIWNYKPILSYKTVSKSLAYDLRALIQTLGYICTITTGDTGFGTTAFAVCVSNAKGLLRELLPYSIKIANRYRDNQSILFTQRDTSGGEVCRERVKNAIKNKGFTKRRIIELTGVDVCQPKKTIRVSGARRVARLADDDYLNQFVLMSGIWVPVHSVAEHGSCTVYDITVDNEHNFVCEGVLVHNCCYQEDTIKFLQQICGLSGSESDSIRRAIGHKDRERLEAALPRILEGYCSMSDKPRDVAEQEAKEFIQVLEDSASYQFNYGHSISYCLVGYLCAWLRYYHPIEFITSYLNNAANDDDIKNGTALAKEYGIRITQPKFGSSTSSYGFDRESNVISKGVSSVKYLNKIVPQELYLVYQHHRPKTFMETLRLIKAETSCDDRQLTNLIKIGYFSDYGNCRELEKIYEVFKYFKFGEAKSINKKKEMSAPMLEILQRHATDKNVKGEELKSYTITDMDGLLQDCEQYVRSLQIPDADFKSKINAQMELMGYVDITTGEESDRRKLLVLDTFELKGVSGTWGVAVTTRSIGTGKEARLTVRKQLFERMPLKKLDVIYGAALAKNKAGYWYLNDYKKLV